MWSSTSGNWIAWLVASALPKGLRQRGCPHRDPRTYPLQPFHDDQLAFGQARFDHHVGPAIAPGLDALDNRLAILDDEHIDAFLVGDQCSLRNDDLFF